MYNNTNTEVLQDVKNGKVQPWREKKLLSRELALAYHSLAFESSGLDQPDPHLIFKSGSQSEKFIKRAFNVEKCGSFLEFKIFEDGSKKLVNANFCKVRLCPMCAWRRSTKVFRQVSRIMTELEKTTDYRYIFLTLTQQNVYADQLADELDKLYAAFKALTYRTSKQFVKISKGWFRALEITHDTEPVITKAMYYKKRYYYDKRNLKPGMENPNFDKYHPHFHVIIAVDKSYFRSKDYLTTKQWVALWRKCLGVDYDPIVDVRRVTSESSEGTIKYGKAVAEISKYSTKSTDYLTDDRDMTNKSVATLDAALKGRRLIGYGGIFCELHKQLNLDDGIDGDLIHIGDDDTIRPDVGHMIKRFNWSIGYNNYTIHIDSDNLDGC